MKRVMRITSQEYAAAPIAGIPSIVHFELHEHESHYRLNLIVSGDNDHDRQELEWQSKDVIETSGYSSPAQLLTPESSEDMSTVYSYNFCPIFEYMPKFDLFRHSGYYVKNRITAAALSHLHDIISGDHYTTSLFTLESEFYRALSTLDLHWH